MSDSPVPSPLRGADPRLARRRPEDAELERQSEITEADVDAAVDAFNQHAPAIARGLLDATPITGE